MARLVADRVADFGEKARERAVRDEGSLPQLLVDLALGPPSRDQENGENGHVAGADIRSDQPRATGCR